MSPVQEQSEQSTTFETQLDRELAAIQRARCSVMGTPPQDAEAEAEKTTDEELKISKGAAERSHKGASRKTYDRAHDDNLLGLAFSGGGIRSATFNLGVIQRLAKLKLLHRVDYLSTVSGGGYIGGWLSAWVHRQQGDAKKGIRPGILGVEDCLRENAACEEVLPRPSEPRQVRWLREFSNYLTPRVGVFSTDTLTGVATYLRNLLLNQMILIASGASLLVFVWFLVAGLPYLSTGWIEVGLWLAVVLLFGGSSVAGYETLRADLGRGAGDPSEAADAVAGRARLRYWIMFSCFAVTSVLAGALITYRPSAAEWQWILFFGGAYGIGTSAGWWTAAYFYRSEIQKADPHKLQFFLPLWAMIACAGLGGMVLLWAWLVSDELASPLPAVALGPLVILGALLLTITLHLGLAGRRLREAGRELWSSHGAHQLRFGVIWLAFAGASLFGPLTLMLANNWVAALGGLTWVLTTVAGVVAGSGSTTGGGRGNKISELAARIAPYVFVIGLLLIVSYGVYRAIWWQWSADAASPRDVVCETAPRHPAYEIHLRAKSGMTEGMLYGPEPATYHCLQGYVDESASLVHGHLLELFLLGVGLMIAAFVLSWRVDINVFSFHMFYRNRIERCYMGASNLRQRRPHPLTGLDPTDAPRLKDLALWARGEEASEPQLPVQPPSSTTKELPDFAKRAVSFIESLLPGKQASVAPEVPLPVQRPFPIINTALNITSARNLAWQERKAASFTFTPMYCGYEIREPDGNPLPCYQPTEDYVRDDKAWISLGVPITISGAAASPNAGYHTSAATAFLMTVFNVRLGWWLQNPRYTSVWRQPGPKWALSLLLQELFGMTTDRSNYVYLSDGGHFENLGIYELVRRRCRYIIACDAGCDPKCSFEDLGNAVRKCQIDLGIDIDIDPRAIRPDPKTGRSRFHCAVGRIHYERVDKTAGPGYLLYIKSSLSGDEPVDILQYAAEHADFPHETTADQWYSESQFESYRKLGYHAAGSILADAVGERRTKDAAGKVDLEEVFTALSERWYPPSGQVGASFSKHGEAVEAIFERVRNDDSLRFLDEQVYPEWLHLANAPRREEPDLTPKPEQRAAALKMLPDHPWEVRAGFYLCNSLLQIMENVYHDLNLEEQYDHPDNRGWMNLFRHWSWAGMLRVTWAISASMYGARFQRFCRRRLDLEVGKVCCGDPVRFAELEQKADLNVLEADHVHKLVSQCFPDRKDSLCVVQLSLGVIRPFEENKGPAFAFPFAFALIDNRINDDPRLLYYRVRDHLRDIGLGREGLAVMLKKELVKAVAELDAENQESISTVIREADYQALRRLWTSVVAATAKEDRGSKELEQLV